MDKQKLFASNINNQASKSTEIQKKDSEAANSSKKPQESSNILDGLNTQQNQFNLDQQEYQQVFKVFDKDNLGEITIQQVYELINKFESGTSQNLNFSQQEQINMNGHVSGGNSSNFHNKIGSRASGTQGIGASKTQAHNNSLYSNGQKDGAKKHISGGEQGGSQGGQYNQSQSTTSYHSRQTNHRGGLSMNGQNVDANGSIKFSPQRKNGGADTNSGTTGINLQLRPTQLTTQNNNNNNRQNNDLNNNRSPRRQSHLQHGNQKTGAISFKLNGIGGANVNNNSQIGSSKSDGKSNEENNEEISPGIIPSKNKVIKGNKIGSANSLLQNQTNSNMNNNGNSQQITNSSTPSVMEFPNGKETIQFDDFINIIQDSCSDNQLAENYLILAFSMFDRQKKGYISTEDLKEVFEILGESITDDEVNTMIKIAGIKSNDKINFKEFVDFFYKID